MDGNSAQIVNVKRRRLPRLTGLRFMIIGVILLVIVATIGFLMYKNAQDEKRKSRDLLVSAVTDLNDQIIKNVKQPAPSQQLKDFNADYPKRALTDDKFSLATQGATIAIDAKDFMKAKYYADIALAAAPKDAQFKELNQGVLDNLKLISKGKYGR